MGTVEKLPGQKYSGPEVGATVYLRSGSPPLTVTCVWDGGDPGWMLTVTWINGGGHHQQCELPVACICMESPPWRDWYGRPE